jgi:hypothetical protein
MSEHVRTSVPPNPTYYLRFFRNDGTWSRFRSSMVNPSRTFTSKGADSNFLVTCLTVVILENSASSSLLDGAHSTARQRADVPGLSPGICKLYGFILVVRVGLAG